MANPADILNDPDFVSANAATKQAIFDKHVANDPSFAQANPQTQTAIRARFGLVVPTSGGVPVGRAGAAQIPTEPGANTTPTNDQPRSLFHQIMGNIETVPALAAGAVGGVVAPIAQLGHEMLGGQAFTPQGKAAAAQFGQQVQQQFYQPRTPEAQRNLQAVGEVVAPLVGLHLGGPTNALAPAIRAVGDVTTPVVQNALSVVKAPLEARQARVQAGRLADSYQNAGRIEAANEGSQIGLVANPAAMNPTKSNKTKSFLTDPKAIDAAAANVNAAQVPKIAINEMGLPPNTALNSEAPFTAARKAASGPYEAVAQIPSVVATPDIVNSIEKLRPSKLVLGKERAAALNESIDTAIHDLTNGLTGAEAVKSISDLREQAQSINNSQKAGHPIPASQLDKVSAYRGIADALEQMLENNVTDPKLLKDFRDARVKMAKIHAYEDATDFNTGKINPAELAKATAQNSKLTGDIATIGRFAGNFPEAMGLTTPETAAAAVKRTLSRATMSGAAGAAIGNLIAPGVGSVPGLAAGAALGELGSQAMANRMVSPKYQAKNALPTDYRTNMLRPVEPNATPNGLVPYTAPVEVLMPGEGTSFQNFTMRGEPTFGAAPTPFAQRSLSNEVPKQIYQAQKNAELAQEFRAAAERKPASGAIELQINPLTGVPEIPKALGAKGATLEIIESANKAAATAAEKMRSGRAFDMTAAEKIQWGKSLLEGMPVAQGELIFGKLTPEQITTKMADRQWVADKIQKTRDQAAAFENIAARAADERARQTAMMKREQLMGLLVDLEDQFSKARPVQKGGQGPKTRAFQRNMLTPEQEIQNAFVSK